MLENYQDFYHSSDWKRINMRNVNHLLGAEFIHDLYNRYDPKINAYRFRHTVTVWKDGILNSYAPLHEWERLGELVSEQFYNLDTITLKGVHDLYGRKREAYHHFIEYLKNQRLVSLSDTELALLLTNFQSLILGELYVLNFVQVEHGLNIAIQRILKEIIPSEELKKETFTRLVNTEIPTESQKERQSFNKITTKWRFLKNLSLYSEKSAKKDILKHALKYQYLYSAYGESPKTVEQFWKEFQNQDILPSNPQRKILPKLLSSESRRTLRKLNNKKLDILIPLLVEGGIFRDRNKALLGQSMKYRFNILDEIARRKFELRENLDFYLLIEIIDLIQNSKKVPENEIEKRKLNGIILSREESLKIFSEIPFKKADPDTNLTQLNGLCASKGASTGTCRIILTKADALKVNNGDIMVAIGTDFDLIEAMYRASAVITEEGGILSHAAVVCRELEKPCCIGVKNATSLLKDGSLITVQATNGLIILHSQ